MMGQTLDPETSFVNQAKTTLDDNPKTKTKYGKEASNHTKINSVTPDVPEIIFP
jgi:hypothetical protein